MPGESVPQGLWLPPRVATLLVAANDALDRTRAQADYICDGVADEVQINLALNALPAGGGRVMLSEGTFTLADPITLPANNISIKGQGRGTFLDGDGLATTEHAIVINGVTNCEVRDLAIQTQDGGTKTCHCIHIANGASSTSVTQVTFVASDSDGVHIDGTAMYDVTIRQCTFLTDIDEHGIFMDLTAANIMTRTTVHDNLFIGTGQEAIELGATGAGHVYCEITDNLIFATGAGDGILINEMTYSDLSNNFVYGAIGDGIELNACSHCTLEGNAASTNGADGINLVNFDECDLIGNLCHTNTSEGIYVDADSTQNLIQGNHVCHSTLDGIVVLGAYNVIDDNYCLENGYHGISCGGIECKIGGNYCIDNSQDASNTYHGINITADGDRCHIEGNYCYGGPDHDMQEDGIHLVSGAEHCSIVGNFCYYLQGDGIALAGNNTGTLIQGNKCYYMEDENGIVVLGSTDCQVVGNHCMSNLHHGIFLSNADRCTVVGNTCINNDRIAGATYDGIFVNSTCVDVLVDGNFCYDNDRVGIYADGIRTNVNNNVCQANGTHGIYVNAVDCKVQDNHCFDNSQNSAGASYGIALSGGADRCTVVGNTCDDPGDAQGDGINLASGAVECQINDNYCYNAYGGGASNGNGITLAGGNTDCQIVGNHCNLNDGHGIYITVASDFCVITGNKCKSNGSHGIFVLESDYCTITGNVCSLHADDDGIRIEGDATHEANYNTVSSNVCTGNGDGIELAGVAAEDCKKTVVIGNQLLGNTNALVDGGENTEIGHNITV